MGIVNNISSNMILGELHKNTKKKSKAAGELSLGEKIRHAGDDASGYAISEKMRVRIRALGQDEDNVKKGTSMLRTAEGAIQSQINLLRTIKEKVIDAHNDTNTDIDREIIQKEINQYYDEINDIAAETTFNKRLLLLGNTVKESFNSWKIADHAEFIEGSDSLDLIPNTQGDLDGVPGPFDTFGNSSNWDGYSITNISATSILGYDKSANTSIAGSELHGGTPNTPNTIEMDLSGYSNAGLNDKAFVVQGATSTFVLTNNVNKNYNCNNRINISGKTNAQVAAAIASSVNSEKCGNYFTAKAVGEKVVFTTKSPDGSQNYSKYYNDGERFYKILGTDLITFSRGWLSSPTTGWGDIYLSGGEDEEYHYEDIFDPVTDQTKKVKVVDKPAVRASATKDLKNVPSGSGITALLYAANSILCFIDGDSAPYDDPVKNYRVVGKNYSGIVNLNYINAFMSDGKITFTYYKSGSEGNNYKITDGVQSIPDKTYAAATPFTSIINYKNATDGETAYWNWDLSEFNVSDSNKADALIKQLVGKAFSHSSYSDYNFEFIDSDSSSTIDSIGKINDATVIDLKAVRDNVKKGKTISESFANLLTSKITVYDRYERASIGLAEELINNAGEIIGVKIKATVPGTSGNDQKLTFKEGHLRSYTIDFTNAFTSKGITDDNIASALDGKGFRFYCATDPDHWVNVEFVNGVNPNDDERPTNGSSGNTFVVDVSDVKNISSLVKTIYEGDGNKNQQGLASWLKNSFNHFFQLAADYDKGSITIYDNRRYTVLDDDKYGRHLSKGAKIADGIVDNIVKDERHVYVNDLVIHHTTRSSANIHIKIPQTTMDHVFGYKVGIHSLEDYSVLTSEKREKLLGTDGPPKVEGVLDKGLQYLIDANTLIGAQIIHLESAEANIVTDTENTTSAESVIRDADMAKSSMALVTAQILSQAGQAMLSQSNQNSSNVLSLLQ